MRRRKRVQRVHYCLIDLSIHAAIFAAYLSFASTIADAQPLRVTQTPPAGFELYDAPQSALVDLYFDQARVGRVVVIFTPANVQFQDPGAALGMIGAVSNPTVIRQILTRNFATNEALVCTQWRRPPLCGDLAPIDVGVIFDSSNLRLDLFLNPNFRAAASGGIEFLNAGATSPSAVLSYGGAFSLGLPQSTASQSYSGFLQGDSAIGDYHYSTRILSQTVNGIALDQAMMARDVRDWTYVAGLFDDESIAPLVAGRLLGVSAETSFHLRSKPDTLYGTPIIIFVPRRGQVDIFRGTRLLASSHMEAGNQTLDTSALPDGAYDLTIKITDVGGGVQELHRYFIKSRDFAPDGQPYFHFDLGMREPYDASTTGLGKGPFVAHAATKMRTVDWLSLNLDLFYFGKILFVGPGAAALFDRFRLGVRGIESTRSDQAFSAYATAQLEPIFLRADFTALVSGLKPASGAIPNALDPVGIGFYQGTASIDYSKAAISMGASAGYRRQSGISQPVISSYIRLPLVREGPYNITLGLEAVRNGRENSILLHITAFQNPTTSGYSKSVDAGYRFGTQPGSPDVTAAINWQDTAAVGYDRNVQARAQHAFDQSLISLVGDYRGPEGRFEANLQGASAQTGALSALAGGQFFGSRP